MIEETEGRPDVATTSQADRVIAAFGGPLELQRALERINCTIALTTIYRWSYPAEDRGDGKLKGTGGFIPPIALKKVLAAAKAAKVTLTDEILSPRVK